MLGVLIPGAGAACGSGGVGDELDRGGGRGREGERWDGGERFRGKGRGKGEVRGGWDPEGFEVFVPAQLVRLWE